MNVHPSAVVNPPGPTTAEPFSPEAQYELRIDTDGDAVADITFEVRFSPREGSQTAAPHRLEGARAVERGDSGQVVVEAAAVSTGRKARVAEAGGYRIFAGWRSDPFFFDVQGILNDFRFTGDDFFADKTCVASCWKCPTLTSGPSGSGCGHAR
jgi:hypothetical protein